MALVTSWRRACVSKGVCDMSYDLGAVEGIEGGALALGAHEARGDHEHLVEAVQGAAFDPGIGQLCEALL